MMEIDVLKSNKLSTLVLAVAVSAAAQAVTTDVVPGWNLLGHSGPSNITVADTFGNVGLVSTVWKWNPTRASWAFYSPGLADGGQAYAAAKGFEFLSTITSGTGFWVKANTSFSATLPGTSAVAQSVTLNAVSGWNLLGHSGPSNVVVADTFGNADLVDTIWKWNPARASWAFYSPGLADGG